MDISISSCSGQEVVTSYQKVVLGLTSSILTRLWPFYRDLFSRGSKWERKLHSGSRSNVGQSNCLLDQHCWKMVIVENGLVKLLFSILQQSKNSSTTLFLVETLNGVPADVASTDIQNWSFNTVVTSKPVFFCLKWNTKLVSLPVFRVGCSQYKWNNRQRTHWKQLYFKICRSRLVDQYERNQLVYIQRLASNCLA